MSSLKLIDGLKEQEVYAVLRDLLSDEKSDRRRITRLETFVCERAAKDRDWVFKYAESKGHEMSDEELDSYERKSYCISPALLFQFAQHLESEKYWEKKAHTIEKQELRMLEAWPGRFEARYPQNRTKRTSRQSMGVLHDYLASKLGFEEGKILSRDFYGEIGFILSWHPEYEDGDRILEVKGFDEVPESLDMVIAKPNGEIWGEPTKTFEQIAEESVIARSRKTGVSGRELALDDPFLGILKRSA